jgi:hypothetical protein
VTFESDSELPQIAASAFRNCSSLRWTCIPSCE